MCNCFIFRKHHKALTKKGKGGNIDTGIQIQVGIEVKDMKGSIEVTDIQVGTEKGVVETGAESEIGTLGVNLLLRMVSLMCSNGFSPSAGTIMIMIVTERGGIGKEFVPDLGEGLEIAQDRDHDLGLGMIEGKLFSSKNLLCKQPPRPSSSSLGFLSLPCIHAKITFSSLFTHLFFPP